MLLIKKLKLVFVILIGLGLVSCATTNTQEDANASAYAIAKMNFDEGNYDMAFEGIRTPAQAGDAQAQYALGYMYYYGKGTTENIDLGKYWIQKASEGGDKDAMEAYKIILSHESTKPLAQSPPNSPSEPSTQINSANSNKFILSANEQSILEADPKFYTLQLVNMTSEAQAKGFIRKENIAHEAKIIRKKVNGKLLYTVIYGQYPSMNLANTAKKAFPASLRKLSPWARTVLSVQKDIKNL